MATEKLAKAYFWRSGNPPPKSHSGFVKYLRFLGATVPGNRDRVSELFSYKRFEDFQQWLRYTLPIAYDLERLTPDLSNDGPNPEYPWPHSLPETAPVEHGFQVWDKLVAAQGRGLLRMVETAINCFPLYADL